MPAQRGCGIGAALEGTHAAGPPDAALPLDAAPCVEGVAQVIGPTGTCYLVFDDASTWDAAMAACEALGPNAQLVTFASAEENALLAPLLGAAHRWIGLTDVGSEGAEGGRTRLGVTRVLAFDAVAGPTSVRCGYRFDLDAGNGRMQVVRGDGPIHLASLGLLVAGVGALIAGIGWFVLVTVRRTDEPSSPVS